MFAPHRAPAVFKGDAAKDQPQQHQDDRHIKRGHHRGIGQREDGEQTAAAQNQPSFIAVPDRRDRVHHHITFALVLGQREQQPDPKVEPVEDDIDQHRKRDDAGPDKRKL